MAYNAVKQGNITPRLWFDVGNEWYTTWLVTHSPRLWLWFDVGNEWYTTGKAIGTCYAMLWFDVGNEWYTTSQPSDQASHGCGLMQEMNGIQHHQ